MSVMSCLRTVVALALPLLVPTAALASPAAGEHDGGIVWVSPVFGNDGKMGLLWILINFAVLMWLLEKLLFSKLRAKQAAKSDAIKSELDRASQARKEAEAIMTDVRARLSKLDTEVGEILDEAKARAEADRTRILEAAAAEAERIKASARASAEREAELRRREVEAEILDAAVARAEVMLRSRIGAADQTRMVDDFVTQLAKAPLGSLGANAGEQA
jgi:F-type H+-transporting ATPase subunit b